MNARPNIIADVCGALSHGQPDTAVAILAERYPFQPIKPSKRRYSPRQMLETFTRDGFIDRYTGKRLVCTAVLRLISIRLPDAFPYHTNWRWDACHQAYYDLAPTIDHVLPVSRGGADSPDNWVTTSMARNNAKANFTLEELGWHLWPAGRLSEWDGLLGWFRDQAKTDRTIIDNGYLREWLNATESMSATGPG